MRRGRGEGGGLLGNALIWRVPLTGSTRGVDFIKKVVVGDTTTFDLWASPQLFFDVQHLHKVKLLFA